MAEELAPPDYERIKSWRSIVTLIVFVATNLVVLFPFDIPIYVPRRVYDAFWNLLSKCRVAPPREPDEPEPGSSLAENDGDRDNGDEAAVPGRYVRLQFPMNLVTAPILADLFLLAVLAIGREEVAGGILGADHILTYDIMIFFITLAYIAISLDASGVIRFLAFKILQWGGRVGHRLFFYLYVFFFGIGSFIGNDPIILSGTAFLAYMTRVSSNIVHPRAWIFSQFAVANIASAILVSSNPTNLVLAGAFNIRFIDYTANMIVPVVITAIAVFPFLLYIVFNNESLIPTSVKMHELPEEAKSRKPVNPNIPNARGTAESEDAPGEEGKLLSLEEIMNPFLDKGGATFGAVVMAVTLVAVLALNAAKTSIGEIPVFYVTLPAAVVTFVWDLSYGWLHRHETREIARKGRKELERARLERARLERAMREKEEKKPAESPEVQPAESSATSLPDQQGLQLAQLSSRKGTLGSASGANEAAMTSDNFEMSPVQEIGKADKSDEKRQLQQPRRRTTLLSLAKDAFRWSQETFPTATAVLTHLPYALIPFAFGMFVLVQALVTKGWVEIFALGWDKWVTKTGVVGAVGGMGFLSVVLCNFAGTNIGATILLSRVIQAWQRIRQYDHVEITQREFWATVYSMALGVNYGAFSTALSASLAGLLWQNILAKKHIRVRRLDFARVNLPIIAIAMTVGCTVLIGEIYIIRDESPVIG